MRPDQIFSSIILISGLFLLTGCADITEAAGINRCSEESDVGSVGCVYNRSDELIAMNCEKFTNPDGSEVIGWFSRAHDQSECR